MKTGKNNIAGVRTGCALQGALAALSEISGVVPVVHASANCAFNRHLADRYGAAGEGALGICEIPATNVIEKQIIFGGGARLREQLKNAIKTVNGNLYIILGSCESAMVGDDIIGMVREGMEQGEAVLASDVAGFHGSARQGYARVFKDIIESLPGLGLAPPESPERTVNVFGIVPREDVRFRGDLLEIARVVEALGLRANTFFGHADGAAQLAGIAGASLNLSFTRWGAEIVEELQVKYGTPSLFYPSPPTGYDETKRLVFDIVNALHLEQNCGKAFLQREKAIFEYFLGSVRERLYSQFVGECVAVVGGEGETLQITGFLSRSLGADIKAAVITDNQFGTEGNYFYSDDANEIRDILEASGVEIIFAGSPEKDIAAGFVESSYPAYSGAILSKTYTGVRGAITLVEDYAAAVARKNNAKEKKFVHEIRQNNV
jgi:nitrogenase molybdenum-iron protein beta chain